MRLLIFFFISALLHSLLLALPSPYWREGKGEAIPVTLVLGKPRTAREEAKDRTADGSQLARALRTIKRPAQVKKAKKTPRVIQVKKTVKKSMTKRPAPVNKVRRVKKPVKILIAKRSPTIARRTKISPSKKIETERAPAEIRQSEAVPMPVRLAVLPDEIFDEALEMEESSNPYPSESLAARELWEEDPTKETEIEVRDHLLASKPASEPESVSPPLKKLQGPIDNTEDQGDGPKELLFVRANYARIAKPEYPARARKMGWEGTTLLRVLVDQQGSSKTVQVSQSSGFDSLDRAAVKAVKRWHFHPARSGTRVVESWVKIPIVFSLKDSDRNSLFVNR